MARPRREPGVVIGVRQPIVAACAAACVAAPWAVVPTSGAGPQIQPSAREAARPVRAAHIRLTGELDAMACVEELEKRLKEAVEDRAGLLILELSANHARPDVVMALAEAVRRAEIPSVGFLVDGRDRRVTPAVLALALLIGDRVAIDPQTEARFERGDWRTDLLPEGVEAQGAIDTLRVAVEERLAAREIDPTLASPMTPGADAAGGPAVDVSRLPRAGIEVVFGSSVTSVARAVGFRGQVPRAMEVETSFAPARAEVEGLIRAADDAIAQARRTLDLRGQRPDDREISVHDHRRAGGAALEVLGAAGVAVDRAEARLRAFPEVLLTPPPGRTDVGTTRQTLRTAWRYRLDDLRKDIAYWTGRANDQASR